jgi:hypothetical protein
MDIRTGYLIEDTWTGIWGRVIGLPATPDGGDYYRVLTRQGINKVQVFNARILSTIQPHINDIVCVTNGTQNYIGSVLAELDNGEFEMDVIGIPGTVSVHPSQMYRVIPFVAQAPAAIA